MEGGSMSVTNFNGPFACLLDDFIELKRSTGYKYVKESNYLKQFSDFSVLAGMTEPKLTKEVSDAWCTARPYENGRNVTQQRITCLRQFALYLLDMGHDTYIPVNQEHVRQRKSEFYAYIFTHDEIDSIFRQSNRIYPHRRSTMHLVMPVLVRLLYCTGIRVMEALSLRLKDIDQTEGIIKIVNAKFDKDRMLPLSASMQGILKEYCEVMHPHFHHEEHLFVGVSRTSLSHHEIYVRFRELLVMAGIPHAGRGNGPRIHDIRHTFCCHTLQQAISSGADLTNMLPLLSEYLGHESLAATSRYLRMTAEVYPSVLSAVEKLCSCVIPEVKS